VTRRAGTEVASSVVRLGTKWANFYLVADSGEFTLIDAGYPRYWKQVGAALDERGHVPCRDKPKPLQLREFSA
jgi:hypothetical protein